MEELHPKSPFSTPPPPKEKPKPGKPEKFQTSSHAPPMRFGSTDASSGSQKYSLLAKVVGAQISRVTCSNNNKCNRMFRAK